MSFKSLFFVFSFVIFSCESAEEEYDLETGQQEVLSREKIDEILSGFEKVKFENLDKSYKEYTDPDNKFGNKFSEFDYYIVEGKDVLKFIVGKFRIQSFLSMDEYYTENRDDLEANHKQYWLVDKKMLYMILDLILELDKKGYDKYGFYVRESHRHPKFNEARGGASQSQHLYGRAADLVIEDINKDGDITNEDKEIALDIMEDIVGNNGGMGLYPGTMTIHIDSRGYAARWDKK